MECIDGWMSDEIVDKTRYKRSKIIKGGHLALHIERKNELISIENRRFAFGCFNNSRKLTKQTLMLFAKVLNSCNTADLILKSPTFSCENERNRIKDLAIKAGAPTQRLKIVGWDKSHEDHMRMYNTIDVALDTLPYSGATTTADAIMMGVPVLTLKGDTNAGALSESILKNSDLEEWIAESEQKYLDKAKEAWKNGRRGKKARIKFIDKLLKSDFASTKRLTYEIEKIYENEIRTNYKGN